MKTVCYFLLMLSATISSGQSIQEKTGTIAEAEAKAASALINFTSNANTANYDVVYHRLRFTVNPAQYNIQGNVTTHFRAITPMNTVTFDLSNQLTVSSVKQRNTTLAYTQNANNELVITLPQQQATGVLDSVTIVYQGAPPTGNDSFATSTHSGTPILWTLSEPYGALDWWPCKQDLVDKANAIDVYITAPQQYTSVSNGLQVGQTIANGQKTTHFRHNYPIPAYLIAIAVTNYQIYTQQAGTAPNNFPIVNYIYPESMGTVQTQLAVTLPIMNLYESLFETYPFAAEKYGHAQFGWGGGMEHTTVSFMGGFDRELIAHELGHQWFGDKITCGSWKDIWLNEGFATYLSGLVREHLDGAVPFVNWKKSLINNITSLPGGTLYLSDADLTSVNRIFSSRLSYNKGAMVVHMLRYILGDTSFYQGLRNYLADTNLAYGYAKTPDLKSHLEAVSGKNLTEFFNDWVYGQGYPKYTITAQNNTPGQVKFTVNQTSSIPAENTFFELPVPVRAFGSSGQQQDFVLDNTVNGEVFIKDIPFTVTSIAFNVNADIIAANSTATLSNTDFSLLSEIKLYPNPATGQLNLSLPEGVVLEKAVFQNVLGQTILETGSQTQWNIFGLASGIHFISILTSAGNQQLKFIKK